MPLRDRIYRQLDASAWPGDGASAAIKVILGLILLSPLASILQTEPTLGQWAPVFAVLEWTVLVAFSFEYVLRAWVCTRNPRYAGAAERLRYLISFFALVDLLADLPSYIAAGGLDLTWLRSARIFRILKLACLGGFSLAIDTLSAVSRNRRYELLVSIARMTLLIVLAATGIYFVEAAEQPEAFGSMPRAMWWSVATLTTVGYDDVAPVTALSKTLAAVVSLLGIALVAVATGILAASFSEVIQKRGKESREPGDRAG
jgi:voltage-gated potassium channel